MLKAEQVVKRPFESLFGVFDHCFITLENESFELDWICLVQLYNSVIGSSRYASFFGSSKAGVGALNPLGTCYCASKLAQAMFRFTILFCFHLIS